MSGFGEYIYIDKKWIGGVVIYVIQRPPERTNKEEVKLKSGYIMATFWCLLAERVSMYCK